MVKVGYTLKIDTDYGCKYKQCTKTLNMKPSTDSLGWILMDDTLKRVELYLKESVIPGVSNVSTWWVRHISIV